MDGVFWLGASRWVRQHAQLQLLPLRVSSIPLSQHQQLHHHQQQQQRTAPWSAAQHFYIPASCTMSWGITPQGCSRSATSRSAAASAPSSAAAPHRAALAASSSSSTAPLRAALRHQHHLQQQHHIVRHWRHHHHLPQRRFAQRCGISTIFSSSTTSCGTGGIIITFHSATSCGAATPPSPSAAPLHAALWCQLHCMAHHFVRHHFTGTRGIHATSCGACGINTTTCRTTQRFHHFSTVVCSTFPSYFDTDALYICIGGSTP